MSSRRFGFLVALVLLLSSFSHASAKDRAFKIVGYLSEGNFRKLNEIELNKLTHLNLAFANPNREGKLVFGRNVDVKPVVARGHEAGLKVYVSLAGGGRPDRTAWKDALQPANRSRFIRNISAFVEENNLDGVDVDIEWNLLPTLGELYTPFVIELKEALRARGKGITAAQGATALHEAVSQKSLEAYDFINVMAYDKTGIWRPEDVGPHSPYAYAEDAVRYWTETRRIPPERIVLGVPFYGYDFTAPARYVSFREIVKANPSFAYKDVFDKTYYNGIPTIVRKTELAKKKVGGVMIWEISYDAPSELSLLRAVHQTVTAGDCAIPNVEVASAWWPEMENSWVPIGWKDHPLRFNVLYNGTLIAQPVRYRARGQGVQLTFLPSRDGQVPERVDTQPYQLRSRDGGVGDQGWTGNAAPVLWTRTRKDGVDLRQEAFAHSKGGGPVQTGDEPLFAWLRLSLESPSAAGAFVLVRVNQPHLQTEMDRHKNLIVDPRASAYPRPLRLEWSAKHGGHLLVDDAGRVRLAVVSGSPEAVALVDRRPAQPDAYLKIAFAAEKRQPVDVLVPLVPADRVTADAELSLGRNAALQEADRFWSVVPATASRVDTPERLVNEAARQAVRFCEVIAERHPQTGQYCLLSGSWHYEMLWATPTSMNITMILDGLGHHPAAEKYLEIFRQEQGSIVPPGKAYRKHAGYLATPRKFTSIDWLTDHGAILHAAAHHALVTDDREFIQRWTAPILKACEFIRDFRAGGEHGGVKGILPAAVPTDTGVAEQSVWNDGWNYKGLCTAVRLLRRINHPRAEEFAREAAAYRESFLAAMRAAAAQMPEWTGGDGRKRRFVPTALPKGGDLKFPFYLDTGPLFLVYSGLMNADDELMRSALDYFRHGPNTRIYDLGGAWHQAVSLRHELSSCEPCYSWNVFHAWQSGDRAKYLEGMYSLLTGSMSRRTSIGCEHRGGIGGTLFSVPLPVELARLSVIDDQLEPARLHLLRLVPPAWLRADRPTVFERIPTVFGPVDLRFQLQQDKRRLLVTFKPHFRHAPERIALHVPPLEGLAEIAVGDQVHAARAGEVITLK